MSKDTIKVQTYHPEKDDYIVVGSTGCLSVSSPDSVESVSENKRAHGTIRGFRLVLEHHGATKSVIQSFVGQALIYLSHKDEAVFFKRAKYLTVKYMALYLKVESPPLPDEDFVPRGHFKRWISKRLRHFCRKNTHLFYSFVQAKRSAFPLSPQIIYNTYKKHRVAMESVDPVTRDYADSIMELMEPLLAKVNLALLQQLPVVEGKVIQNSSDETDDDGSYYLQRGCYDSDSDGSDSDESFDSPAAIPPSFEEMVMDFVEFCGEDLPEISPGVSNDDEEYFNCFDKYSESYMSPGHYEFSVSTSACLENTREDGGQRDELLDLFGGKDTLDGTFGSDQRFFGIADDEFLPLGELISMSYKPWAMVHGKKVLNYVVEHFVDEDLLRSWAKRSQFWYYRNLSGVSNHGRVLQAKVASVLEPLKVRVISKGPAAPYYGVKSLQKALHSILRKYKCFRLIGQKLDPTDLCDLVANRAFSNEGEQRWMSVDYSAATDNVSARLAERLFDRVTDGLDPDYLEVARQVLKPHQVFYPKGFHDSDGNFKKFPEKILPVLQTNGQLMGSPLSFPFLCLENLASYLLTVREDPRPFWKKLQGVLINGDDMLFVGPERLWNRHINVSASIGLETSVGKAYYHHSFANANSQCYHYDLRHLLPGDTSMEHALSHSSPYYVKYLNSGLFFGQNKILRDDKERLHSRYSTIEELYSGALPGKAGEILSMFLSKHAQELRDEVQGRNLFIPIALGGMGVIPPSDFRIEVTESQKRQAMLLSEKSHILIGTLPALVPVPKEDVPFRYPWDVVPEERVELVRMPKTFPDGRGLMSKADCLSAWHEDLHGLFP